MNKVFKFLSLFVVFGLVACSSKTIDRAGAKEILLSIQEKQETEGFRDINVCKIKVDIEIKEITGTDTTIIERSNVVLAIDRPNHKAYVKIDSVEEGEITKGENWLYLTNDKMYFLTNEGGKKIYVSEDVTGDLAIERFEEELEPFMGLANYYTNIFQVSEALNMIEELNVNTDLAVTFTSEDYKTKGDGNITSTYKFDLPADEYKDFVAGTSTQSYSFDNYLLSSFYFMEDITTLEHVVSAITVKNDYKKAGISLPKLSDFTRGPMY